MGRLSFTSRTVTNTVAVPVCRLPTGPLSVGVDGGWAVRCLRGERATLGSAELALFLFRLGKTLTISNTSQALLAHSVSQQICEEGDIIIPI